MGRVAQSGQKSIKSLKLLNITKNTDNITSFYINYMSIHMVLQDNFFLQNCFIIFFDKMTLN